jgi:hypothetical protein
VRTYDTPFSAAAISRTRGPVQEGCPCLDILCCRTTAWPPVVARSGEEASMYSYVKAVGVPTFVVREASERRG